MASLKFPPRTHLLLTQNSYIGGAQVRPEERGFVMKALTRIQSTPLAWHREPELPPSFTLCGEAGPVATLQFLPGLDTLARVETANGTWTLLHRAFPADSVTLREPNSRVDLATFHHHPSGRGELTFLNGDRFHWLPMEGVEAGGAFLEAEGMPLVRLTVMPDHSHRLHTPGGTAVGAVEALPPHHHQAGPELLAAFGWYLIQLEGMKEHPTRAAETALRL